jgi:hypothetical protein
MAAERIFGDPTAAKRKHEPLHADPTVYPRY